MKDIHRSIQATMSFAFTLCAVNQALAQSATVTLGSQKQYIRGFGGMSHAAWAGDLTAAERTLAFGNGTGQLGFSILRIPVTDGSPDSVNVATAKAAIAAGAIVFATPWNAAHTYTSADFASYATHLNDFVTYMQGQGVSLYSISVQNEPDYGATSGWGSWTAANCHDFVLNYGATITGAKLMSCESFNYNKSYYDPILNDSAALANVGLFGTHLYGTAVSAYAYPLWNSNGAGKEMWMTEHYTDSTTDANSWPNALGVATEIHNVMVTGQMNAYVWWYIVRSYGPIYTDGTVSKRGWCMGHWSKFIRPGFYRVDATATPTSNVLLSAYTGNSNVVIVAVNNNTSASSVSITVSGSTISSYTKYTTSSSKSLASDGTVTASNGSMSVSLDASSVTTLYGTGNSTGTGGSSGTGGASSTGGSPATGGSKATGGSSATGGTTSTGGSKATGGSVAVSTGGSPPAGGSRATGGSVTVGNTGGTPGTGGSRATGGSVTVSTGGTSTSVGGSNTTTGGMVAAGGSLIGNGGNNQVGGMVGTGGVVGAGGSLAAGGAQSTGGIVGSAGSENTSAGTSATNDNQTSSDSGSCSCRVAGERSNSKSLALLGMLGVLALGSRRRRAKN